VGRLGRRSSDEVNSISARELTFFTIPLCKGNQFRIQPIERCLEIRMHCGSRLSLPPPPSSPPVMADLGEITLGNM